MAAELMPKIFFHMPSGLCFTPIGRQPTLFSNFISSVFQKRKATTLSSDQNTRESGRKHTRDRRSHIVVGFGNAIFIQFRKLQKVAFVMMT